LTSVATYRASKELFANLTLRELRSKYKRSFLGWTWSMVNPLATMLVYTIMFKVLLRIHLAKGEPSGLDVWALFLLCGLLPWNFFSIGVTSCIGSLIGNEALIKKTYFPRELLPASAVAAALVTHLIEIGLLIVALLGFGNTELLEFLPVVILLTVITALFALGFGLMLSALNVYFRDIQYFTSILFLIWLYLTPIVYPYKDIPARFDNIIKLNPMTDMALSYQAILYDGHHPGWIELAYFAGWALVFLVVGLIVFNRLEANMAEEL
jgi:ABC-type polysaccharide/polyol phosphate export permease